MRRPAVLLCSALLCTALSGSAATGSTAVSATPYGPGTELTTVARPALAGAGSDWSAGGVWSTSDAGFEALLAVALLLLIAGVMTGAHQRWPALSG